jgi:DNA-binding NtrC family response regulator
MERAVILADGELQPRHLSLAGSLAAAAPADPWDQVELGGTMSEAIARVVAEVEKRKIARALKEAGGDRGRAADSLQIGYKALAAKMRDYGLE